MYLDVSDLPPPEPMAMILDTLESLSDDRYLHVHHRRYPRLLYDRVERLGYSHDTRMGDNQSCEIFIWRQSSSVASLAVKQAVTDFPIWNE